MQRVTISVPDEVVAKAQRAVESGDAPSLSAFFAEIASREPDWAAGRAAVDRMIAEIGGLSDRDIIEAEQRLGFAADVLVAA